MLAPKWLSILALAAFAVADVADNDVPELVIDKTYVPSNCTEKSAKGDWLEVRYVSDPPVVWFTLAESLPIFQSSKLTNDFEIDPRYVQRPSLRD